MSRVDLLQNVTEGPMRTQSGMQHSICLPNSGWAAVRGMLHCISLCEQSRRRRAHTSGAVTVKPMLKTSDHDRNLSVECGQRMS
jgi:hypothetical protein